MATVYLGSIYQFTTARKTWSESKSIKPARHGGKTGFSPLLVHGQVTIIFVVSVCLFVCAEFFSAVFDPISIKLGHTLRVWV